MGSGFTLVELMVIVAIIALLIAFLMPAIRSTGSYAVARRVQCLNNCKQIGLALLSYEQAYHSLPPAYTVDADGRPLHSWRTLILPYLYMEQEALYRSIDLAKPWNDPANAAALATPVPAYRCPSTPEPGSMTSYLGIATPDGCFPPGRARKLEEITDGPSSTLLVIEAGEEHAVPWMAPVDADAALVMGLAPTAKLHKPGGMNAVFADGRGQFLHAEIAAQIRRALISVSGHEDLSNLSQ